MTMWKELRKKYTDYTLDDVAKSLGITRQAVSQFEKGRTKMPIKIQIVYLQFRNNKYDQIIINHLKSIL